MSPHQQLLATLRRQWSSAGRPDAWEMAGRAGLPAARFEFLFRPGHVLPDWEDVAAVLSATGVRTPAMVAQFHQLWVRAGGAPHGPPMPSKAKNRLSRRRTETARPDPPTDADSPIQQALQAESRDAFVLQLRRLRERGQCSFGDISARSGRRLPRSTAHWIVQPGNFPPRAEQVREFTRGCGASDSEIELWVTAWSTIRRGTPHPSHHTDRPRQVVVDSDALTRITKWRQRAKYPCSLAQIPPHESSIDLASLVRDQLENAATLADSSDQHTRERAIDGLAAAYAALSDIQESPHDQRIHTAMFMPTDTSPSLAAR